MNVGFDRLNLANATKVLVSLAKERGVRTFRTVDGKPKMFDLSTEDGASDYLMTAAEDVYARSANGVAAQIREVIYYSLGVVFELAPDESNPPVLVRGTERPAHLAFFWQVL